MEDCVAVLFVSVDSVALKFFQVLPIWEGTSTVMSLDVLRAIQKSKGNVLNSLFNEIRNRLGSLEPEFQGAAQASFDWSAP